MADRYDFYFQSKKPEDVLGFKFFTAGFSRTVAVRGVWKLTCQWLKCFMTPKGSDPTEPEYGTEFSRLIGTNITNMQDLRDVVMLAIEDCNTQIQTIQRKTQPATDELLLTAVLTQFQEMGKDGFEAWVTVRSLANKELTIRLPDLATRK